MIVAIPTVFEVTDISALLCPVCAAPVSVEGSCPGYPSEGGRVMVCYPYCGNAMEYRCSCGWWYRDPVGYRADTARMGVAPAWLDVARARYSLDLGED